jgi:succinoglycan biosynthesis protein ExoO
VEDLVSIIMPAYNAERYIKDAIESVLKQTYSNFEFIIVNDGSKDRTLEIAKSYKDERIKIIDFKENRGVSHARNVALDIAKGKWIALNAADDVWKPERLEHLLGIVSKYEYGKYFIADNVTVCLESNKGQLIPYSSVLQWKPEILKMFTLNDVLELTLENFVYITFQPIIPSAFVKEHRLKFVEELNFAEDLYFYAKLQRYGMRMLLTKESFYFYRLTPGSLTDLSVEDLKRKVEKFNEIISTDKDFSDGYRNIFASYFSKNILNLEYAEFKRFLLKGNLKKAFGVYSQNNSVLKMLITALFNPCKVFNHVKDHVRIEIVSRRAGGLKRL